MRKQYAVLGLGGFGTSTALTLQNLGCDVIAVDQSMEKVQAIAKQVSYAMKGNVEEPEFMQMLGARNLDGIIIALSTNREASIMATLLAKEVGVPYIIAKAHDEKHEKILLKIGADAIVHPEREMGTRVAKNLVSTDFADWIALSPEYSMVEVETPDKWVGKTLKELEIRRKYNLNVVGYFEDGNVVLNPDPDKPIENGIIMIVMGPNKSLQLLKEWK